MDDRYAGQSDELKQLGAKKTDYTRAPAVGILETFPNRDAGGEPYLVEFTTEEFTSLCPRTGQPDFAEFHLRYVPAEKCIESKSLKLYLFSYRNEGQFMESITNQMLQHFVEVCHPLAMILEMDFNARGGIGTKVEARYFSPLLQVGPIIAAPDELGEVSVDESTAATLRLLAKVESLLNVGIM